MDEWNTEHHSASGLIDRVRHHGVPLTEAEAQTLDFLDRHTERGTSPLCGNTIWQDRRFLSKYMPEVGRFPALPHHRRIQHQGTRLALASGACRTSTKGQRPPRARRHSRVDQRAQVLSGTVLSNPLNPQGSHLERAVIPPFPPCRPRVGARAGARAPSRCAPSPSRPRPAVGGTGARSIPRRRAHCPPRRRGCEPIADS